jgi:hypothetical protein
MRVKEAKMRFVVVSLGLVFVMVLSLGCATTSAAREGMEQDTAAAEQQVAAAGAEAEAAGAKAEEMGEDWKDKALEGSAAAMGCSKDEAEIDDWQGVLDGSWDAKCGDNAFSCSKSEESGISCEPKSEE